MQRLLTVDEVAERLNASPRFVRQLTSQRRLGFTRVGRKIRIAETDLESFVESGRVAPLSMASAWRTRVDA